MEILSSTKYSTSVCVYSKGVVVVGEVHVVIYSQETVLFPKDDASLLPPPGGYVIAWVCACVCSFVRSFVRYVFVTPGFALLFHSLPQGGRVSTEHMTVCSDSMPSVHTT